MQTITIKTNADNSIIEAIKTLILASDKDAIISYDETNGLSKDDANDLLKTHESYKKGNLELMSNDEFKKDLLENGYQWK